MPIESNCPGCGTKVRVPESLLGKRVKCPSCDMIFTAEVPDPGFEEVPEEQPTTARPRASARVEEDDDFDDYDEPRSRRSSSRDEFGYRRPPPTNGLGIASMVLGLVSFPLTCIGGACAGIPCAIVGLVLSFPAFSHAKRYRSGKGFAVAGLVLNLVVLALFLLGIVIGLLFAGLAMHGNAGPQLIRP